MFIKITFYINFNKHKLQLYIKTNIYLSLSTCKQKSAEISMFISTYTLHKFGLAKS